VHVKLAAQCHDDPAIALAGSQIDTAHKGASCFSSKAGLWTRRLARQFSLQMLRRKPSASLPRQSLLNRRISTTPA
jgi:hypothetical protein